MIGPRTRGAALALGFVAAFGAGEASAQFIWPWQQQPQQAAPPRAAPPAAAPRQLAPPRTAPRREAAPDGQQRARREGPEGRRRGATGPLTSTSAIGAGAGAGASGPAGAAEAGPSNFPRRLDQRAIRTRFFDGEPINARALGGELFTVRFHPDGRLVRTSRSGEERAGRWRFQGDAYCSRWEGNPTEFCHTIVEEGQVVRVVRNTRAVATWARGSTPPAP